MIIEDDDWWPVMIIENEYVHLGLFYDDWWLSLMMIDDENESCRWRWLLMRMINVNW